MFTFYKKEINSTEWEVPEIYENLEQIGSGTYGQVCKAQIRGTDAFVAIKKLARPFQSAIHAKRAYREIRLLKHMDNKNVIGLLDVFHPHPKDVPLKEFNQVYLVTHLMDADLNSVVRSQQLTDEQIQFLVYQILRGIKYIHSAGIIHRDLKPSNLAVNEDCELRILDFGLARPGKEHEMTGYVATRWYRAPEIILNWRHYTKSVDIWSVGCILAELLTGQPLFPGTDYMNQLHLIFKLLGTPTSEFLAKISSESARVYIESLPKIEKRDFSKYFARVNPLAINLLERMLDLDFEKRITAEESLAHPYLQTYADPNEEPNSPLYDQSFEDNNVPVANWKQLVFEEVVNFTSPPSFINMANSN